MKSYVTYAFNQDQGPEISVSASVEPVIFLNQKGTDSWNPNLNKEVPGEALLIQLSIDDARELANNLLKAAQFAEENERPKVKSGRY